MPINPTNSNTGGWRGCGLRSWMNADFYNALPEYLRALLKKVENLSRGGNQLQDMVTAYDYCALPAFVELYDTATGVDAREGSLWEYYLDHAGSGVKAKPANDDRETNTRYRLRTPRSGTGAFRNVTASGGITSSNASVKMFIAPFGCL